MSVLAACREVAGHGGRRERYRHHERQEQEVKEKQRPVDDGDVVYKDVMVDPDDADGEEADQVRDEGRPVAPELVQQPPVAWPGYGQVQRSEEHTSELQ